MFLSEALKMNGTAQIILASAVLLASAKGVIWVFRCPKDSPNYKLPPLQLAFWRETKDQ
jgi:hypothetical protein